MAVEHNIHGDAEQEANARLIASAPELLEAVTNTTVQDFELNLREVSRILTTEQYSAVVRAIELTIAEAGSRAAIAKATNSPKEN